MCRYTVLHVAICSVVHNSTCGVLRVNVVGRAM